MNWIECTIYTESEAIEILSTTLIELDIKEFIVNDDDEMHTFLTDNKQNWDYVDDELINKEKSEANIVFYVEDNANTFETINIVKAELKRIKENSKINLGRFTLETKNVKDEDWENNWKKFYKPMEVGKNIVIKPEWESYENTNNKLVFNINPGHVFGTGMHQTTQLSMISIEKYLKKDQNVIDLGCGSGILSIISLMLGAKYAYAIDIEPSCVKVAYENADMNNINKENYKVEHGNILTDTKIQKDIFNSKYDIVIANIVADVIIALSDIVNNIIHENSYFITSGIISSRLDEVILALEKNNLQVIEKLQKDDWICLVSKMKNI